MLFEKESHHGSRNLVTHEEVTRDGRIRPVAGLGFRHGSIWEQLRGDTDRLDVYIESIDGHRMYQGTPDMRWEDLVALRDKWFPECHAFVDNRGVNRLSTYRAPAAPGACRVSKGRKKRAKSRK